MAVAITIKTTMEGPQTKRKGATGLFARLKPITNHGALGWVFDWKLAANFLLASIIRMNRVNFPIFSWQLLLDAKGSITRRRGQRHGRIHYYWTEYGDTRYDFKRCLKYDESLSFWFPVPFPGSPCFPCIPCIPCSPVPPVPLAP